MESSWRGNDGYNQVLIDTFVQPFPQYKVLLEVCACTGVGRVSAEEVAVTYIFIKSFFGGKDQFCQDMHFSISIDTGS